MVSSMPEFTRPRHHQVWKALESFDAGFLNSARCYFGGGTRIVLELAESRESADVDFLCADGAGYRKLRNTIKQNSLVLFSRNQYLYLAESATQTLAI